MRVIYFSQLVASESAESTKLRVVYDASTRASENLPSLNECFKPGPPLENQLWNVLVRARFQSSFDHKRPQTIIPASKEQGDGSRRTQVPLVQRLADKDH